MAQLFPKIANTLFRVAIVGAVLGGGAVTGAVMLYARSPYFTGSMNGKTQPIQFSHAHHVNGLGIDCRYCHTSAEQVAHSNVPPTKTCMNCHSQIWVGSEMLSLVRDSYKNEESIEWKRLHRLADFAYFDHSIHLAKGVGCASCHGRIDQMQAVYQKGTLLMEWCLDCHRAPENHLRPRDQITNMAWSADQYKDPADPEKVWTQHELGTKLKEQLNVRSLITCSTCHR